jgi:hypothetical protein
MNSNNIYNDSIYAPLERMFRKQLVTQPFVSGGAMYFWQCKYSKVIIKGEDLDGVRDRVFIHLCQRPSCVDV